MSLIEPGASAVVETTVSDQDTAVALGSGDVPVLGTPRLLALAEAASVEALAGLLDPGTTSVGLRAVVEHLRASPVGARVAVMAELTAVEGRRVTFEFTAWHHKGGAAADGDTAADGESAADGDAAADADAAADPADTRRGELIGSGTVERVVVQRERFIAGARKS